MITKLVVMRPGKPDREFSAELPERPGYRALDALLRPLLDGGDLEHVLVYCGERPWLGDAAYRDMFIDDEGHAQLFELAADGVTATRTRPGKNLPRNDAATELYLRNVRLHEPTQPDDPDYFIAGPAVLFPERRVWF